MTHYSITDMVNQLVGEEAIKYFVYDDATGLPLKAGDTLKGNPTVGVGRNLATVGLSASEAKMLLVDDIYSQERALNVEYPWWKELSPVRQMQMIDLRFNLGGGGLAEFKDFLAHMKAGDWEAAAKALRDSEWWKQVGQRGPLITNRIVKG